MVSKTFRQTKHRGDRKINTKQNRNPRVRNRFRLKATVAALLAAYGSAAMAYGDFSAYGSAYAPVDTNGGALLQEKASVQRVFTAPTGYVGINAMTPYNGALYVGVDDRLFRITNAGCKSQEEVTPGSNNLSIQAIVEFKGALFVADLWGNVHRSLDGRNWQKVRDETPFGEPDGTLVFKPEVQDMLAHNGFLFLAVGHEVYRTTDGNNWELVVGHDVSLPASWVDDPVTHYSGIQMAGFEGVLYVSVYRSDGGHQIWRTYDGAYWSKDNDVRYGYGIVDMEPFNNHLYGLGGGSMQLNRRDSNNRPLAGGYGPEARWHWLDVTAFDGMYDANALKKHNGKLYLSAYSGDAGALASWNSKLYVGVTDDEDSAAVYEYAEPGGDSSQCVAASVYFTHVPSWSAWTVR